jgi:DNA polymerase III sliding clamp (beta) subunit (PCNA family)
MNRAELVKTLELLKPALAQHDTVPIFQCFTFTDGKVIAYNDALAIVAPSEVKENFGVHGATLLGILSNNKAEEVTIESEENDLVVTSGKSITRLPYKTDDEFLFEQPSKKFTAALELTQTTLEGIGLCRNTVSKDETQAALHGITVSGSYLYSCDGDAVTRFSLPKPVKGTWFIPTPTCDAILRLWKDLSVTGAKLHFNDEWVFADFDDWQIYGRVPEIKEPLKFEELVKKGMHGAPSDAGWAIPEGLDDALSRARVLADPESAKTTLKVQKSKLTLFTETHMGQVDDVLPLKGHADIEVNVSASHVQSALKNCKYVAFLERCTMFTGDDVLLLVSHMG